MAVTPLTVNSLTRAGIVDALAAAGVDGHTVDNTAERMWIEVENGSGASINVTIDVVINVDGLAVTDRVVAVAAGVRKKIGPFPSNIYNDGNSDILVTFSAVTDVTIGAFSI
jgi:hypothetical protein